MTLKRVAAKPAVAAAVGGDVDAFLALVNRPVEQAGEKISRAEALVLGPEAVRKVLTALRAGAIAPSTAQQWASFVRRGYLVHADGRQTGPIDIEYSPEHEDLLVEIVGRLDEIGDVIDGHVSDRELDELLAQLAEACLTPSRNGPGR